MTEERMARYQCASDSLTLL